MKHLSLCFIVLMLNISASNFIFAQELPLRKVAILNFDPVSFDHSTAKSIQEILKYEINKLGFYKAEVERNATGEDYTFCENLECAIETGNELNVDEVILLKLLQLGEKIIVQYDLVDVKKNEVLISDNLTSVTLEELDVIMKRIAMSISEFQPVAKTAEMGNLTEDETRSPLERNGRKYFGFSFGYLYPSSGYINYDRSFTMDYKVGAEVNNFDYGIQVFARKGFGINIFSSYLFSKKDICPYIGAGAGFHWIDEQYLRSYNYYSYDFIDYQRQENLKGDGFEVLINGGVRLFHTYSLRITVNAAYSHTFNDFDNDSFVITLGFIK